jgi:hypothetical protein
LLLLHRLSATGQRSVTTLGDDHLCIADRALIPFAYLVCQVYSPLLAGKW